MQLWNICSENKAPLISFPNQVDTIRARHGEACRLPVPHHFLISLKSFTYNTIGEDADVFFFLYDVREGKQIRYVKSSF